MSVVGCQTFIFLRSRSFSLYIFCGLPERPHRNDVLKVKFRHCACSAIRKSMKQSYPKPKRLVLLSKKLADKVKILGSMGKPFAQDTKVLGEIPKRLG